MPILSSSQITTIINDLKQDRRVKGILLTGSYAYGTPHDDSDIELICVTNDGSDFALFDQNFFGVPSDVFFNDPNCIRTKYWPESIMEGHGDALHFWANGKIMYDEDGTIQKLREEARELWIAGPPQHFGDKWIWRWKKHNGGYPKANWEKEYITKT